MTKFCANATFLVITNFLVIATICVITIFLQNDCFRKHNVLTPFVDCKIGAFSPLDLALHDTAGMMSATA